MLAQGESEDESVLRSRLELGQTMLAALEKEKMYDAAIAVCERLELTGRGDEFARKGAIFHATRGDNEAMRKTAMHLSSKEQQLSFVRKYGGTREVVTVLLEQRQDDRALDELLIAATVVADHNTASEMVRRQKDN